ncbi:MAG TPA: protein-methionine-sulfoxide reductase catalytic subunit MsrP [Acidobacteriota bacterium]|jgi:sulfoxide reductase catalytic subunit YedY
MLIRKPDNVAYSEVTPKSVYVNRREFLKDAGCAGAGLVAAREMVKIISPEISVLAGTKLNVSSRGQFSTDEKQTPFDKVSTYNNYYEFGTGKEDPSEKAKNFKTSPWSVSVEGLVNKPKTYDMDSILKLAPLEERVYRHRCVEAWSIVVPWIGYSLSHLIKQVEPNSKARYVAFQTYFDSKQMPQARYAGIPFPYVEGLRLDEAMHPLALLCVGMYGETLPNQNGAPVRIVVPWKYGFKSIKSLVKIRFVEKEPPTTWNLATPREYGFYSNVNPEVDHPRWSQASERRLGEFFKRKTLMFNGYGDQVAGLYKGMDLRKYY